MKPVSGEIIDRYRITGEIGTGGMGSVYSAIDMELNRTVAIKILHMDSADASEQQSRFRREVKALSSLDHPNVVRIFAVGLWRGSFPYLVMELLEGESLASLLSRRGSLPESEAVSILLDVTNALAAVHSLGIIHRDLKPQNIFLSKGEETTVVKVLDFGLCRPLTADERLTGTGLLVGSVHYMSPEVSSGKSASLRSDIYALGIILYEMLTGSAPFQSDTFVGVLFKHANVDAPLLVESGVSLPHAEMFDRVLARCLTKKENDRYQSTAALSGDLELLQRMITSPENSSLDFSKLGAAPVRAGAHATYSRKRWFGALAGVACLVIFAALVVADKCRQRETPIAFTPEAGSRVFVRRSIESLREELDNMRKGMQDGEPFPVAEAVKAIDIWAARTTTSPDDLKQAQILKAHWLILSNKETDRIKAEEILKFVLADVQGRDDLLELLVRTELAALYNRNTDRASILPATAPVYALWKKHSQSAPHSRAAYGALRMRVCETYFPDPIEEEAERLKLLEVAEKCRHVAAAEGPFLEDLGNYIDRLIAKNEFQRAKPHCERSLTLISELHRDFRGRNRLLSRALLRKADVLDSEKLFAEAKQLRDRAKKIPQTEE